MEMKGNFLPGKKHDKFCGANALEEPYHDCQNVAEGDWSLREEDELGDMIFE